MILELTGPGELKHASITPVRSKSISNRLLMVKMLTFPSFPIFDLSNAKDTLALQDSLNDIKKGKNVIYAGAGGTTYRFLTALLASREGEWTLYGDIQIYDRPVGDLVEALCSLGADIRYIEKHGFPPLQIKGKQLPGGKVTINSSVSSQFISALLLIAPTMEYGLDITLQGNLVSRPYIEMTLGLMNDFGIKSTFYENKIKVLPGKYINFSKVQVEPDWTAASYFYSIVALVNSGSIILNGYKRESVQGDKRIASIMTSYGVETNFTAEGIHIKKGPVHSGELELDMQDNPDLVPTLAVLSAALGIKTIFRNIHHLAYKESDRLMALQQELFKLNCSFRKVEEKWVVAPQTLPDVIPVIETYDDHRIAMAFAPLACLKPIKISNPSVVNKSYPEFWDDLQVLGFSFT